MKKYFKPVSAAQKKHNETLLARGQNLTEGQFLKSCFDLIGIKQAFSLKNFTPEIEDCPIFEKQEFSFQAGDLVVPKKGSNYNVNQTYRVDSIERGSTNLHSVGLTPMVKNKKGILVEERNSTSRFYREDLFEKIV